MIPREGEYFKLRNDVNGLLLRSEPHNSYGRYQGDMFRLERKTEIVLCHGRTAGFAWSDFDYEIVRTGQHFFLAGIPAASLLERVHPLEIIALQSDW